MFYQIHFLYQISLFTPLDFSFLFFCFLFFSFLFYSFTLFYFRTFALLDGKLHFSHDKSRISSAKKDFSKLSSFRGAMYGSFFFLFSFSFSVSLSFSPSLRLISVFSTPLALGFSISISGVLLSDTLSGCEGGTISSSEPSTEFNSTEKSR